MVAPWLDRSAEIEERLRMKKLDRMRKISEKKIPYKFMFSLFY